jgi:hypothetical protein
MMKSFIENHIFSKLSDTILITTLFLQACLSQPTLTPKQVQGTAIAAPFCTLASCWDILHVKLTGEVPVNFIVKVEDVSGRVGAMQCFEDKQASSGSQHSTMDGYLLTDSEAKKISQLSPILGFCKSNTGYFNVTKWQDESLASIVVQCFEAKQNSFINSSSCRDKAVSFASFSPSELTISVYWNEKVKTKTVKPVYQVYYPNGENCEPECRNSVIDIELP